jgi:ketosteroid isomerase-like protein
MSTVQDEIMGLEEQLRQAELGPDPAFFERVLADDVVMTGQDGKPFLAKKQVVEAHQPSPGPKFTRVEMSDMKVVDHGSAAVVTCGGTYESPSATVKMRFLRVWAKKGDRWQIVAVSIANG